jgi:hypothetical protein
MGDEGPARSDASRCLPVGSGPPGSWHGPCYRPRGVTCGLLTALNRCLQGMGQARHAPTFEYLSEEALSLIALARRE